MTDSGIETSSDDDDHSSKRICAGMIAVNEPLKSSSPDHLRAQSEPSLVLIRKKAHARIRSDTNLNTRVSLNGVGE